MTNSKEYALNQDQNDKLAHFKEEFYIQKDCIYLDGNSLGLLSKRAENAVHTVLEDWKHKGIDGWIEGEYPWFYLSEKLGSMTAPLVGASPDEVVVTGSTTVNLHQCVSTFFQPEGKRNKIMADELTFPSDIYALKSQLKLHGLDPETHLIQVKSHNGNTIQEEDLIAAMDDEVALIVLPTVLYRSGQLFDIERLTKEAHQRGITIGFDACHSIGAVPHHFDKWDVDFAFWCNYKYLNNGPGGTAGLYVNKKHFSKEPLLAGWFGSKKDVQFDMSHEFTSAESAGAFQIGTPHILSAAPLIGSLSIFEDAGIEQIRSKSLALTRYLMELVQSELDGMHFNITNPFEDKQRGGHVSLQHDEAARICKALKQRGVIPDFRQPNVIRLAPVALYTSFTDVWNMIQILKNIMQNESYKAFENKRDVIA